LGGFLVCVAGVLIRTGNDDGFIFSAGNFSRFAFAGWKNPQAPNFPGGLKVVRRFSARMKRMLIY
jgi:hypothetical protein